MEVSARMLTRMKPIVAELVRENVRDIRNHAQYANPEETDHLHFIANTLETSLTSANKALETNTLLNGVISQYKNSMDPNMIKQLRAIQSNQQVILQCNAKTLLESGQHYQQQFMPGSTHQFLSLNSSQTDTPSLDTLPSADKTPMPNADNSERKKRLSKKSIDLAISNSTHYVRSNPLWTLMHESESNGATSNISGSTTCALDLDDASCDHTSASSHSKTLSNTSLQQQHRNEGDAKYNDDTQPLKEESSKSPDRSKWIKAVLCVSHFLLAVGVYVKNEVSIAGTAEGGTTLEPPNNEAKST